MKRFSSPSIDNIAEDNTNIRQLIRNAESNPSDYNAWNKLAERLLEEEEYKQAIISYDKAIEINPNNKDSWYNRGLALTKIGKYDEAIQSFDKAISIDPDHIYAWNSKAHLLNYLGKFREAISSYDRVIDIDANNVIAWYNKGLAFSNLGKYDEAILCYNKVLKINANNTDALNAKGLALERLGKYDEAILCYNKVIEIDANNTDAIYNKAHLMIEDRKYDEAAELFNKILAFDPANISALDSLHLLYSNYTFEFDKSLSTAMKLFEIQPTPERKMVLAEDFIKTGKYKRGRELALEAKKEIPENKIRRQSIIRLLILSSYLMEGDSIKGNEQLSNFLSYYKEQESFKIEEDEWNFEGLIKAVNPNSTVSYTKTILIDLIDLLRGKGDRGKILARLAANISESRLQISRRTSTGWKVLLPVIIFAAIAVPLIIITFAYMNMINHQPCSVEGNRDLYTIEKGKPRDIAINPNTDIVYIANSNSKNILAIDCINQKIMIKTIPTNGIVRELDVDPTSNKIYAVIPDNNNILIIDGNNNLGINDISEMADDLSKAKSDEIIYDSPEYYPKSIKTSAGMPVTVTDIAFNPKTGKLYAANDKSDIISVVNSKKGTTKNITGVGATKLNNSLVVNPNTNKIYVTNPTLQKVSVIDGKSDSIIENIPVGRYPFKIAVDSSSNRIYVAHKISNTISIIDGNKDQVVQILPTSLENNVELNSIAVDSKTHMLYLDFEHNDGSHSIRMVNPAKNNNTYIQVAQQPVDLEFNVNNSKLYVAEYYNGSIAVIDSNTNTLLNDISLGQNHLPFNIAVNPKTNNVYVSNLVSYNGSRSSIISVIDSENDSILKNVSIPFQVTDMDINPNNNKIYVVGGSNTNNNYNYLSIIDGQNNTKLKNDISIPFSPSDMAVNPNNNKIYLANNKDWSLTIINDKGDNATTIKLNIPPESLVVDPNPEINRIYVTSYTKPTSSKDENSFDPTAIVYPRLTQIQMINGSNDTLGWEGKILSLDPKYGSLILTINPANHDFLATSLSTDTILSWDDNKNEKSVASGRILGLQNQIPGGIDPSQLAMNAKGDKLYIVNPTLNAIKVEDLKAFESSKK
jgi:YVTN family beta-propeller protein